MVIDSSAIIAILAGEPEQSAFIEAIDDADLKRISTATLVEASIVIEARYGVAGVRDLDRLLMKADVEPVPFDMEQSQIARQAYSQFGKGRHRAGLNFGDCFSYALSIALAEPLLCKGSDFVYTDVILAIKPRRKQTPH